MIGSKVRRLYHRWQNEAYFPYDFTAEEHFDRPPETPSGDIFGPSFQEPIKQNQVRFGIGKRAWTCSNKKKPLDPECDGVDRFHCDPNLALSYDGEFLSCWPWDGHGEIIGLRGTANKLAVLALPHKLEPLALRACPSCGCRASSSSGCKKQSGIAYDLWATTAAERRGALAAMGDVDWPYAPDQPDLDLVVDDMIEIVKVIQAEKEQSSGIDIMPPTSVVSASAAPNSNGWNNTEVLLTIKATDEPGGSGVEEIEFFLTGAQIGGGLEGVSIVEVPVSAEGLSELEYFARDVSGNQESANFETVQIDLTPPIMTASASPVPNANGWNNSDVLVAFSASDDGSGLESVSDDVTIQDEGADQEILGVAVDRADNSSAAGVVLNIDKTAPTLALIGDDPMTVTCRSIYEDPGVVAADNLDGNIDDHVVVDNPVDTSVPGDYAVTYVATDLAGNQTMVARTVTVADTDPPALSIELSSTTLWPPNHKSVPISAGVEVSDTCDPSPIMWLMSVTSNEPDNGRGDGDTTGDVVIVDDFHFELRAERSGWGDGRVYTVTYTAEDSSGNTTTSEATVTVPPDQRNKSVPPGQRNKRK
jgi:hypothetical protein